MKPEQDQRLLDPLVGRALLPEQSGPVAEHPPVGRATATLASLKKYLVREIGEARTREEHYRIGGFKNQLNYNDGQKDALIGTLKWLEWNESEESRAANAQDQR